MKSHTQKPLRKLTSLLLTLAMLAMLLPALTMTASAAAAVSVITSATFKSLDTKKFLAVTFTEPVCGNPDCTAGLTLSNFRYTNNDNTGTNFASIASIQASPAGVNWALLVMNAASAATDTADAIGVVDVYTASGMVLSKGTGLAATDAGTVLLTEDTTAPQVGTFGSATTYGKLLNAKTTLQMKFTEPVVDEAGNILAHASDMRYSDDATGNAASISTTIVSNDRRWLTLIMNAAVAAGDHVDETDDGIGFIATKVYDLVGNELTSPTTLRHLASFAADTTVPAFSSAYGRKGDTVAGGNDIVLLTFSEPVFSAVAALGNLATTDLDYADAAISGITHTAGDTIAIIDVGNNITGAAFGTIDSEGDTAIYDAFNNVILDDTATILVTDNTFPFVRGVWVNTYLDRAGPEDNTTAVGTNTAVSVVTAVSSDASVLPSEGSSAYRWTDTVAFATGDAIMINLGTNIHDALNNLPEFTSVTFKLFYEDAAGAVAFTDDDDIQFIVNDAADTITPSLWAITTDLTEGVWTDVTIDLTSAVVTGATALDDQAANPQFYGLRVKGTPNLLAVNDDFYIDNVRFKRGPTSKSNSVVVQYSESVDITGDPADSASAASSTAIGNMTTNKAITGLGTFATGTFSSETTKNTIKKATDGSSYMVTFADQAGGLVNQTSPTTLRGIFTPIAGVTDNSDNALSLRSFSSGAIGSRFVASFDVSSSATAPSNFSVSVPGQNQMSASWTVPGSQSGFSHFAVLYKTTGSSVAVTDNNWDDSDEAALSTSTTSSALVTGLTQGTTYYMKVAAVDRKGLATFNSSNLERQEVSSGPTSSDTTGPEAPSGLKAVENASAHVVLTWTDPTTTDLEKIQILRSIGDSTDYSVHSTVVAGLKTYTDTAVLDAKKYNYQVRGLDNSANPGTASSTVSITIGAAPASTADSSTADSSTVDSSTADSSTADASVSTADASETEEEKPTIIEEKPTIIEEKPTIIEEKPVTIETATGEKVTLKDAGALAYGTKEVETMVAKGIIKGDSKGYFNPSGKLNRAEAAAMIHRILGLGAVKAPSSNPFTDVSKTEWYAGYVADLKAKGLVKGKTATTYAPAESMNRAEFLTIAMNAYENLTKETVVGKEKGSATFSDVGADAWYNGIIGSAVKLKFVDATKAKFNPSSTINRLDATIILNNMFASLL